MSKNIKLRCLEISADAKEMFDFTKDIPFDTSFLVKLIRISAPDTREENEDEVKLIKCIGRNVLNYVNKEKARIRAELKRQPGYYDS